VSAAGPKQVETNRLSKYPGSRRVIICSKEAPPNSTVGTSIRRTAAIFGDASGPPAGPRAAHTAACRRKTTRPTHPASRAGTHAPRWTGPPPTSRRVLPGEHRHIQPYFSLGDNRRRALDEFRVGSDTTTSQTRQARRPVAGFSDREWLIKSDAKQASDLEKRPLSAGRRIPPGVAARVRPWFDCVPPSAWRSASLRCFGIVRMARP
jgi:hypothetical protein